MSTNPIRLAVLDTVKAAWEKIKGSKKTFWAIIGCSILVEIFINGITMLTSPAQGEEASGSGLALVGLGIVCVLTVIGIILRWGMVYVGVQRAMDLPVEFSMIKNVFRWNLLFRMIGLFILSVVVFLPALIFLFIPSLLHLTITANPEVDTNLHTIISLVTNISYIIGLLLSIYLLARLYLASVLVIVKNSGPWIAIKTSFKATQCNVLNLMGLCIINMLIVLVSIIPLGIGLIWSLPYIYIADGEVYKRLVIERQDLEV